MHMLSNRPYTRKEKASTERLTRTLKTKLQRAGDAESMNKKLLAENLHLVKSLGSTEKELTKFQKDVDKLLNDNEYEK